MRWQDLLGLAPSVDEHEHVISGDSQHDEDGKDVEEGDVLDLEDALAEEDGHGETQANDRDTNSRQEDTPQVEAEVKEDEHGRKECQSRILNQKLEVDVEIQGKRYNISPDSSFALSTVVVPNPGSVGPQQLLGHVLQLLLRVVTAVFVTLPVDLEWRSKVYDGLNRLDVWLIRGDIHIFVKEEAKTFPGSRACKSLKVRNDISLGHFSNVGAAKNRKRTIDGSRIASSISVLI